MKEDGGKNKQKCLEIDEKITKRAIEAISKEEIEELKQLFNKGLDPDSSNEKGVSLLHLAVSKENVKCVKLLLEKGADPNQKSPEIQRIRIKTRLNPLEESIFQLKGLTPMMTLIAQQEDGGEYVFVRRAYHGRPHKEKGALEQKDENEKKLALLSLLIAYKGDSNMGDDTYGLTPLHLAVNSGNPALVRKLIDHGADVHKCAFTDSKDKTFYRREFTPIMMAGSNQDNRELATCIRMLIKAGAKGYGGKEDAYVPTILYRVLSSKYPELSRDLMERALKIEGIRFDRARSQKVLDEFLRNANTTNDSKIVDLYVDKILHPKARHDTIKNDATYYAHLHSWVGVLNYDPSDTKRAYVRAEGWEHILGIPEKIRHLMLAINKLTHSKLDTLVQFGEKKDQVLTKLKREVYHMANSYYTLKHSIMLGEYYFPSIEDRDKRKDVLCNVEAIRWCQEINQLKIGEVFSIGCGNLKHAIYIDYLKQPNNNISKIVYNLGAGSSFHNVTSQGRMYPYVIADIPHESFKKFDGNILEDLARIIKEVGKPDSEFSLKENILKSPYDTPKRVFSQEDFNKSNDFFPMKPQVAGNCTVKNLNACMLHHLKNRKLFRFVKNFEIDRLQERLQISKKLIARKELEKDVRNFEVMLTELGGNLEASESEIFHFLKKRTNFPQKIYQDKAGDRIADVIKDLKDPQLIYSYYVNSKILFNRLDWIARVSQSEKLQTYLAQFHRSRNLS